MTRNSRNVNHFILTNCAISVVSCCICFYWDVIRVHVRVLLMRPPYLQLIYNFIYNLLLLLVCFCFNWYCSKYHWCRVVYSLTIVATINCFRIVFAKLLKGFLCQSLLLLIKKIGVHFSGMSFNALAIDWFGKRWALIIYFYIFQHLRFYERLASRAIIRTSRALPSAFL